MTLDLFEHTVLCNKCSKKMKQIVVERSGFKMRALECHECGQRAYHPADIEEFNKFNQLKNQNFKVKLRLVGNSYAVSIPREIVDFFREAEEGNEMQNIHEKMERMVTLALEQANKLSLSFSEGNYDHVHEIQNKGIHTIVREKAETKPLNINGGKGFVSRKVKVVRITKEKEKE
jgi:hypothetical protein